MIAGRCIFDDREDWIATVGYERVADNWQDLIEVGTSVLHGHPFGDVVGIEGPGIDDLFAVRVDEAN